MSLALVHGVENNEEFTHAGGERLLCRFASPSQALMELLQNRIAANCDNGTHVHYRANPGATAGNHTLALPGAASTRRTALSNGSGARYGSGPEFWEHRGDRLGKALEPLDHCDQDVLGAAVRGSVITRNQNFPPSVCSIQSPRIFLWPEQHTSMAKVHHSVVNHSLRCGFC